MLNFLLFLAYWKLSEVSKNLHLSSVHSFLGLQFWFYWKKFMSKKCTFLSIFLEITKFRGHRVIFSTINNCNVFFCYSRRKYNDFWKFLFGKFLSHFSPSKNCYFLKRRFLTVKKYFFMLQPKFSRTWKKKTTAWKLFNRGIQN